MSVQRHDPGRKPAGRQANVGWTNLHRSRAKLEYENTGRNNGMKKLAIIAVSTLWISGLTAAYSQTPRTGTEPGNLPAEKPEIAAKIAEKTKTPGDAVIVWNANAGVAATKACIA